MWKFPWQETTFSCVLRSGGGEFQITPLYGLSEIYVASKGIVFELFMAEKGVDFHHIVKGKG